jgi:hypothetical protein
VIGRGDRRRELTDRDAPVLQVGDRGDQIENERAVENVAEIDDAGDAVRRIGIDDDVVLACVAMHDLGAELLQRGRGLGDEAIEDGEARAAQRGILDPLQ